VFGQALQANIGGIRAGVKQNREHLLEIAKTRDMVSYAFILLVICGSAALAQTYPNKAVRIVVPVTAGGITDIVARALAQQLTIPWGQPVIVDNRPGGGTLIGAQAVLRSAPDGYTLMVSADETFVMLPHLYSNRKFDPLRDFTPITGLGVSPQALVVYPLVPVKSVAELVEYGRKNPNVLNYGTFGIGSSGHLNIERMQTMTGARFTPVHYRGAAPAIIDLIGGHIQFMMVSIGLVKQAADAGQLNILAVGSKERLKELPNLPTLGESGLQGFETGSWYGLVAPSGAPPEIISKINKDTQAIFNDEAFQRKSLAPSFIYSIASDPEAFATIDLTDILDQRRGDYCMG
jgi:tripartite-type tricarboxylate transporter receptor subunit TctC